MFSKILIANRGEIACRVIKTARRMGIAHGCGLFRRRSRCAACRDGGRGGAIGPPPAARVLSRRSDDHRGLRQTGAQAVHPGYGFLSERADFAAGRRRGRHRLHRAEPRRHRGHGRQDRIQEARRRAPASRPCPAISASSTTPPRPMKIAAEIGYPVMIKASAGGGGKGMRIAWIRRRGRAKASTRAGSEAQRRPSATTASSSRNSSSSRATSRSRCSATSTATSSISASANARSSAATRRSSRRRRRRSSTRRRARAMGEQAVALAKAVGYDSRRHGRVHRRRRTRASTSSR